MLYYYIIFSFFIAELKQFKCYATGKRLYQLCIERTTNMTERLINAKSCHV